MCAYHRLIYHTPTDCPTMPTTTITTTTTNSNSITCCDSFTFYETCAIPTIYPLSISSLFIFCFLCFLLSYSRNFLSSSYTFFVPLFRKLPWLSRQSDRLLTDRSLVRSQAEAWFFAFSPFYFFIILFLLCPYSSFFSSSFSCLFFSVICIKKYASRGSRTHDRAVKSRALYRLS